MGKMGDFIGKVCEKVLPTNETVFYGDKKSNLAICTLADVNLLKKINDSEYMNCVSIAGRLFTENRGIENLLAYLYENKHVKFLVICGKDVWGHKPGESIIKLKKFGVDENKKIIHSSSPEPIINSSDEEISHFQNNVKIIDLIGNRDFISIQKEISKNLQSSSHKHD